MAATARLFPTPTGMAFTRTPSLGYSGTPVWRAQTLSVSLTTSSSTSVIVTNRYNTHFGRLGRLESLR